ncbi:hypothetical protein TUBRATIS_13420 [Tubulinosema ratisbonensis]|uniref:Uncharacterized protein n=1 Tax=Tubulinosema ratisbonensis TaxID=291195 RepID=A0A437AM02_9MICR|nr:hypothetical protein TUBRATIS_13420 [Tubulinosema ratisbonensis]
MPSNKKQINQKENGQQTQSPYPAPNTYPLVNNPSPMNNEVLYYVEPKKQEEEKRLRSIFEKERKIICYETGLDLKDIHLIEKEYSMFGMEGLVRMGNEYMIPDWYEYKLHEFLHRNKRFLQKEDK